MRIIKTDLGKKIKLGTNLCATIGNFDGVHKGHQALINECKKIGEKSVVITFYPHPITVLKTNFNYCFLTALEWKTEIIRNLGADYLIIVNFTRETALTKKDDFIKWLKDLGIKSIVCGTDTSFGYKNEGTISDLKANFNVKVIDDLFIDNIKVSSSNVKKLLEEGNIKQANKLLGRCYTIEGVVVEGFHNGEKLGYRTANLDILGNVPPKKGVYAVNVIHDKKKYLGMCNVGYNPTIGKLTQLKLETHIFNFDKMIYGDIIKIQFIDYIREETKFNNLDELKNQLKNDKLNISNKY